jgi:geranylgeranyl diphosphate synthase type I
MLATDDQHVVDSYRAFGWSLGIAFQLNDDLLGIWGDEQTTGKEPSDLAKHKKTLPIIYALERAPAHESARLRELLATPEPSSELIAEARQIIERSGGHEYTRAKAREERDEALRRIESAGVVKEEALDRLRAIVVSAISA